MSKTESKTDQTDQTDQTPPASLRDRILGFQDQPSELVTVPEWGDLVVEVKGMTGADRARMMQAAMTDDGSTIDFTKLYPSIIIACTYDPESGTKVFKANDEAAINAKSGAALERVAKVGMRLSGMGKDAEKAAGKD